MVYIQIQCSEMRLNTFAPHFRYQYLYICFFVVYLQ